MIAVTLLMISTLKITTRQNQLQTPLTLKLCAQLRHTFHGRRWHQCAQLHHTVNTEGKKMQDKKE